MMDVIRKALLWQIIQAFIVLLCIKTQLIQIEDQRRRTIRRVVTLVTIRHSIHRPRIRRPGGGDKTTTLLGEPGTHSPMVGKL